MAKRITLEVPDSVRERLDKLKAQSEAASITEVVRRALTVYELLLDADMSGGSVLTKEPAVESGRSWWGRKPQKEVKVPGPARSSAVRGSELLLLSEPRIGMVSSGSPGRLGA